MVLDELSKWADIIVRDEVICILKAWMVSEASGLCLMQFIFWTTSKPSNDSF